MRIAGGWRIATAFAGLALGIFEAVGPAPLCADEAPRFIDQGAAWPALRRRFYEIDQGSRLIPRAWLEALTQADGTPFLADGLARYGYLPNPGGHGLPVGFSLADTPEGPSVGMTCAACHVRDIRAQGVTYRIDGGPAFGDFGALVGDLDAAALRALASPAAFAAFAGRVVGPGASPQQIAHLHDAVALWSVRLHTLVERSFPKDAPWGPARLDAMGLIYDFLLGTDIGPAPTYLLPDNIERADAPARYPFLWDEFNQDFNQWGGFQKNGTDTLALARNLGEVIGVFAVYHPLPAGPGASLDRDYVGRNTANLAGLQAAEEMVKQIGAPKWPWPVDAALVRRGAEIFARPAAEGGCAECHAIAPGEPRGATPTWRTPVLDVGTDTRAWRILLRKAATGSLEGANIPAFYGPLKARDLAINILKVAVVGAIEDAGARQAAALARAKGLPPPRPSPEEIAAAAKPNGPVPAGAAPIVVDGYESRVLRGIWAAAPYLHNGSVPTLADLLKPAAERPSRFAVGEAYDLAKVGLAAEQPGTTTFTLHTTGCEDRDSGNSRCGHEYGTRLPAPDKAALLEYLKTL